MRRFSIACAALVAVACAPRYVEVPLHFDQLPTLPRPEADLDLDGPPASDPMATPPPRGFSPATPFPAIAERDLDNGLALRVVTRRHLPVASVSLVVRSGQATDRDKPGVAVIAGELLKQGGAGQWSGRALLDAVESLGADLEVLTDRDATTITISVTTDHLSTALDVLAAMVTRPRFDRGEFDKLRQREIERVGSLARESPEWAADMVLYRDLYQLPAGTHPYARFDATAHDLDRLTLDDCKRWVHDNVTPGNAFLVVAGDVDPDAILGEAGRAFKGWKGTAPTPAAFTAPMPPSRLQVRVVDRPGSVQSAVVVAALGPERQSAGWPDLAVALQVLGGGVAGRLFLDVREKRSLAYSTGATVTQVAHGPVPIVVSAGTRTDKTGETVDALLENLAALGSAPPRPEEVETATDYIADSFALHLETVDAVAALTAHLGILGLPGDWYDSYRSEAARVDAAAVQRVAHQYFDKDHALVVVSGDAARIAEPLSHFGPVQVIDPEHDFTVERTLPEDPTVSLEVK